VIKLKILIIDDETDYCSIMKNYFNEKNYEVFLAFTLHEGLAMIEKIHPDILFLDNNLPDGQGWKSVDEIVEKYPQIRIYLISAYRHKSDFVTSSPNITVWEKPISLNTLNAVFA
jgi:two-component system OmpR family response regulator